MIKNTLYVLRYVFLLILVLTGLTTQAQELTFHGRIVDSTTNLGINGAVTFRVEVRTPTTAGDSCIMYREDIVRSVTNGVYVLRLNAGLGTPTTYGYTVQQVFSNKNPFGAFNFAGTNCTLGSPISYTPGPADSRRVSIMFNDPNPPNNMAPGTWEPLPTQVASYVPTAIESLNVGGFPSDSLLRVVSGTSAATGLSPLNVAQYNELISTLSGNSSFYLKATDPAVGFTGTLGGDVTGTQAATVVTKLRGIPISATPPGVSQTIIFNGTSWVPFTDGGGTVTNVSSPNSYLTVTTPTSTPVITANVGTVSGTLAAGNDARIVGALQSGAAAGGDLAGTFPNPTVANVGGKTAAQISTSVADTLAATASNTPNAIVRRDGSGNASFTTAQATNFSGTNLYLYNAANTKYAQIKAPNALGLNYTLTLPTTAPASGTLLITNASGDLSWVNPSSIGVTNVTATSPVFSSGGSTPNITIQQGTTAQNGYISSTDWNTFNNKLSTNLPTGQAWIGSASGTASPKYLDVTNIRSVNIPVANPWFSVAGACAAGQTLTYSAVTDQVTCAAYSITSAQVTTALGYTPQTNALPANQIFVGNASGTSAPVAMIGDASIVSNGTLTISNNAITNAKIAAGAVNDSKISDVNWVKVTSTPTTINGYGITDAILLNTGGVDSMEAHAIAARPAANAPGVINRVFVSTDTGETYWSNGVSWIKIGSAIGSGGTVTNVTGVSPISVTSTSSTPVVSISQANGTTNGYLTSADWSTFNAKLGPALPAGQFLVGNAGGVATAVSMTGDATLNSAGALSLSATGVTSGTYTKLQVDAKGRVTSASNLTSADVTAGLGYTPVNKAGDTMTGTLNLPANGLVLGTNQLAATGGGIVIGASALTPSAQLEVSSTTLGFLIPRMTTAQRNAIATPARGLQIFNTSTNSLDYYDGATWLSAASTTGSLSSLNGLTAQNQLFAVGSAGTDFNIASVSATHTFNIPNASLTNQRGLLTSTDYTRFNTKVGLIQVDPPMIINNSTPTNPIITLLQSSAAQDGYLTSSDWTVFNNKLNNSLTTDRLWIGVGGVPTALLPSGDITSVSGGNFQLATTGVVSGTYAKVSVDAKGRVTGGSGLNSSDVTNGLGYTPVNRAGDTMSGALNLPSNGLNVGAGQLTVSGTNVTMANRLGVGVSTISTTAQFEVSSTTLGFLMPRMTTAQRNAIVSPATGLQVFNTSTNSLDYYNGASWLTAATTLGAINSLNGLTSTSQTFAVGSAGSDFNISSSGSTHTYNIPSSSAANRGLLTSNDWSIFNNKQTASLANGQIWVGNASGTAAAVTPAGDVASALNGSFVLANSGVTSGTYGSASAVPSFTVDSKGRITLAGSQAYQDATAVTKGIVQVGAGLAVSSGSVSVSYGAVSNTAAQGNDPRLSDARTPTGAASGDLTGTYPNPTIAAGAVNTSKLANLAVTNAKINDVDWSKVTSTPTTIAGYGILDAVLTNAGGVQTMQAGTLAARPAAAGVNQRFYVATDTGEVYLAVSSTWVKVGSASGSGGTVTNVTGTAPISVANTSSTPVVSIARATATADGYLASSDFSNIINKVSTIQVDPPLIINNGTPTSPIITLLQASGAQDGYLTSSDWTSFNTRVKRSGDTMTGQLVLPSNGLVVGTNQLVVSGTRVSIGSASAAVSSVLDLTSTTAGFLLPRMSTAQRDAIVSPALGLQVFNTTSNSIDYYNGLSWLSAASTVGAIANLNGLTAVSQTFAVGSAGTDFNVSSAGSVHTFNIPNSSASNQRGLLTSTDWSTFNAKLSNTLTTDRMWVGVSGVPTAVLPSGDISSISGGVFTLAPSGAVSGTYAKVQVDAKGRVTSGGVLNSTDVTTGLGFTPVDRAGDTMTGRLNLPANGLIVGSQMAVSGSGVVVGATALTTSAAFEVSSTTLGFLMPRVTTAQRNAIASPATGLQVFNTSTNSIDYYNGSVWLSAASSAGALASLNGLAAVSQTFATSTLGTDFSVSSSGSIHSFNLPSASVVNRGLLTSSDWATFNAKVTNNLASGTVWIGNGSASATSFAVTGDAALSNSGVLTLANSGATSGTYTKVQVDAKGRVTSGSNLVTSDITSALAYTPVNRAGDTMTGTLNLASNGLNVGSGQLNVTGGNVLASGRMVAGASALTTSAEFEVSSTTLGFLMPRMTTAQRNAVATPATGLQVFNTSTNSIDYYNGSSWQSAASSSGALASLNGLTAVSQTFTTSTLGTDFSVSSSGSIHSFNLPTASAVNQRGLLTSSDWTKFNTKVTAIQVDPPLIIDSNQTNPTITLLQASGSQDGFITATNWNTFNNKVDNNLPLNQIWVGSAGSSATATTVTGDATMAAGNFQLVNTGVASGTYAKVSVDAKGRVTGGSGLNSTDVTNGLGYTPVNRAGDTMTGRLNLPANGLIVGSQMAVSGSGVVVGATALTTSAAFEVSSTTLGFLMPRMTTAQRNAVATPATGLQIFNTSTNTIDYYNGASWASAASSAGALTSLNGLTAVSQTFTTSTLGTDFSVSSSGSIHSFNLPSASVVNRGLLTSSDWAMFNAKLNNSLSNGSIWVGDGTNTPVARTIAGDATVSSTGVLTLASTGVASGTYAKVSVDAKGRVTGGSGLSSSDVTSGLGYTPVNKAGDTMSGQLNLPNNGLVVGTQLVVSGTNVSIGAGAVVGATTLTPSAQFEVSSTTLGFLMPRVTTAQRNAISSPATGLQVFNTSTNTLDYYNGASWASAASSAGALTSLNGLTAVSQTFTTSTLGTDFSVSSSGSIHSFNLPTASAVNQRGLLTSSDWTKFNSKVTAIQVDPPLIIDANPTNPTITLLQASGSQDGFITAANWTTFNNKVSNSLASGTVWIGNGSASATSFAVTGDAALSNSGVLTLASTGVASGTYTKLSVDAKGRVTGGSSLVTSDITSALAYTPVNKAGDTMTGTLNLPSNGLVVGTNQLVANSSGVVVGASALTPSASFEVSSTTLGFLMPRVTTAQRNAISSPATGLQVFNTSTNTIDYYNGASWASAASSAGALTSLNGLTAVSQTFTTSTLGTDFSVSSSGSIHSFNLPTASAVNQRGLLTSSDWATFNAKVTNNLASGTVWIGNGSASATSFAVTGDAALSNSGVLTLASSGATSGTYTKVQVDAKGRVTSGSNLVTSDITSALAYTPVNKAGDTMTGTLNLPTNGLNVGSGQLQVTGGNVVASGRMVAGASALTTSAEFEVSSTTLGFLMPRMTTAQRNAVATPATGLQIFNTSTNTIDYYNGASWASAASSAGALTSLNGLTAVSQTFTTSTLGTDFSVSSSGSIHSFNLPTASAVNQRGLLTSSDWTKFNTKVTAIQVDPPLIIDANPTNPTITLLQASGSQDGFITATNWNTFNNKVDNNLPLNQIWVGSAGSSATATTVTGDATMAAGNFQLVNTGVASGTYTKLSVDAKGRVTGGSNLVTSDITNALAYTPVNRAGDTMTGTLNLPTNGLNVGSGQLQVTGGNVVASGRMVAGASALTTSAEFEVSSTTLGFLMPRMTTAQRNAVASPATGLQVFNTSTNTIDYYNGSSWASAASSAGAISSLNGLTATTQTFATSTLGTDFSVSSSGSVHQFNIPSSSAANRGLLTSSDWATFNAKVTNNLASGTVWIGNGSASATSFAVTGDAALSNSGVLTLASTGVTSGTYTKVSVDAKGRVTGSSSLVTSDITSALAYTPVNKAGDTMSGTLNLPSNGLVVGTNQLVANSSGVVVGAAALTPSASLEVSSTTLGFLMPRMTTAQRNAVASPATGLQVFNTSTNTIDYYNGSSWASAASSAGAISSLNGLTATTQTFATSTLGTDFSVSSSGSVHQFNIPSSSAANRGLLLAADWTTFNNKVSNSLASGTVWIGNGSASATSFAVTGDAALSNSGVLTLASTGVTSGTYTKLSVDAKGRVTGGSSLVTSDITSALAYTPVNKAGDTMTGTLNLPSNGLVVGTNQLVANSSGVVVGASALTPSASFEVSSTTLGFLMPRVTTAQRNAISSPATGLQVFNTSTNTIDYYNGSSWASAASAAGAISNLNGLTATTQTFATSTLGTDFSVSSSGSVHQFNLPTASAVNQRGLLTSSDWTKFNSKVTAIQVDPPLIIDANPTNPTITLLQASGSQDGFITATNWTTFNNKVDNNLASGTVWIGNGSASATSFAITGDAALSNSGVLTLASTGVASGTYTKLSVDAKGRVTGGSNLVTSDITNALAYTPVNRAGDTMTGTLNLPTNGLNVGSGQLQVTGGNVVASGRMVAGASALTTSAEFEVSSTTLGFLMPRMTTAQRNAIATPATGLQIFNTSTGAVEFYSGAAWTSLATGSSAIGSLNGLTATTQTFATSTLGTDFSVSSSGSVHQFNIPSSSAANRGLLLAADWTTFNNKVSNSLASGTVWIGNGSASATSFAVTGDAALSNSGVLTLASTGVASGTYTKLSVDAKGRVTGGSSLVTSDITSALAYTPVNKAGDTMTGTLNLPSNGLVVGTNQLVANSSGVVVGASALTPSASFEVSSTTLGFLMPRMTTAQRNAVITPAIGLQVFNTSTNTVDYYNGTVWVQISTVTGGITSLNGLTGATQTFTTTTLGTDFSVSSSGTIHSFNIPSSSAANRGLLLAADWTTFNNKVSNSLASGTVWIGNGSASATSFAVTGDAALSNSGVLTLASTGVASGTYTKLSVDAKGRVTGGSSLITSDITSALAYTPVNRAGDTMTGTLNLPSNGLVVGTNQLVANSSGVVVGASALTPSASFEVSSTTLGFLMPRVTTAQRNAISSPATGLQVFNTSTNTIDYYNGGSWQSAANAASAITSLNGQTATTQTFTTTTLGTDFSVSSSAGIHSFNIPSSSAANRGLLLAADWTTFNNKVSNSLASGTVWIGNGSASATSFAVTGDAALSNSGVLTLASTGVASGTYTKLSVDAKGRVTGGTSLSSTDITTAINGTLPVANGGTGLAVGVSGGIPYYSSTTTMASSALLTSGGVVLGGGAGAAPVATAAGAVNQVFRMPSSAGSPSFGAIELGQAAAVSGTLAVANGGTGVSTTTRNFIFAGPSAANGAPLFRAAVSNDISGVGFVNGGNQFGSTASFGTADNQALIFETNNVSRAILSATGTFSVSSDVTVGVSGTNTPTATGTLQVNGQGYSKVIQDATTGATLTWDTNNGNTMRWTTNTTGTATVTVNMSNVKAGAAYMLIIKGSSTGAATINCTGISGTSRFVPANGSRVGGSATSKSVYTIMYDGEDCLVTWITGY